tara:strand:- start:712 stop:2301 length:1590 start_codon:yes stop_codon:yes gene_type:complete
MKSRLSYFLISGIIILSISIAAFIWINKHLHGISKLNNKSFTAPISSNYIPENADFIFHWKINPTMLPNYIGSNIDQRNEKLIDTNMKLIRDTSFQLIGLDFTKDIAEWSGEYGSFSIFSSNNQPLYDWLMVIEIKKDINISNEIKSIDKLSIIDEDTNENNKVNMTESNIISKRINSNESIFFLNEKEHLLISSNPSLIKSSINQLENNKLSIKEKYKNIQLKDNINNGILLLEMSPKKIFNLIGQGKGLLKIDEAEKLISSINIDKKKLALEGILSYSIKDKRPIDAISNNLNLIEENFSIFDNSILIDNPKQYFRKKVNHPYQELIASIIKNSIKKDYSNLIKIILENTTGNLIWLKDKEWLAITKKADSNKQEISNNLKKEQFLNSNLEFKNKNLEVWSKITANNNDNKKNELKENIEAIIEDNEDVYLWSQDLSSISNFNNNLETNIDSALNQEENNNFDDVLIIHLGNHKTKEFLSNFYPYILLKTMLGNKIDFPQNIDISVAIPSINYPSFVKFKVDLKTSY